jgi:hypothetical protein
MAVLANPFANARAIGFNSFGWIAAVFEGARVVLVPELRCANPPPSSILRCMGRSFHQLVDHTRFLLLVLILLRHPSVFNELPCKLVAELLEGEVRRKFIYKVPRAHPKYLNKYELLN